MLADGKLTTRILTQRPGEISTYSVPEMLIACNIRYAASKGDNAKVRQMLRQGFAVDSCDYDGRTALMLAAAKGNEEVIQSLLAAGCDPQVCWLICHSSCKKLEAVATRSSGANSNLDRFLAVGRTAAIGHVSTV